MRQDGTHGKPTRVFEQLVLVGYQTVEAVTRLNDSGLIHRDLKLDNVMVRLASPRLACRFAASVLPAAAAAVKSPANQRWRLACRFAASVLPAAAAALE